MNSAMSRGRNLEPLFRSAEGHAERLPRIAAELVEQRPEAIVAVGPEATLRAVHAATTSIPVVMVAIDYDPVGRMAMLPAWRVPAATSPAFLRSRSSWRPSASNCWRRRSQPLNGSAFCRTNSPPTSCGQSKRRGAPWRRARYRGAAQPALRLRAGNYSFARARRPQLFDTNSCRPVWLSLKCMQKVCLYSAKLWTTICHICPMIAAAII